MENLAELKGIVARLQASLEKETIKEFKHDILAAIRFNKRRVHVLERRLGIGLTVCLCVGLMGCEPPVEPRSPSKGVSLPSKTSRTVMANISGFCQKACCCAPFADGITASGHVIQPGDKFIAAPKNIPFGTLIDVPEYGKYLVLDRGGSIRGSKLDLYFCDKDGVSGHQRALIWGRRFLTVTIEEIK